MIQRRQSSAYSIPPFYLRTLLSLDESLNGAISREKEAKKKMNATNAKALTAVKHKVKKALKEHEHEIKNFQEVR
jgi:translation initiation factor 3 subunit C